MNVKLLIPVIQLASFSSQLTDNGTSISTTTADSPLYMLDTPFLTNVKFCCSFFGTDSFIVSPSSLIEILSSAASTDKVLYIVQLLSIDKYLPLADNYGQISCVRSTDKFDVPSNLPTSSPSLVNVKLLILEIYPMSFSSQLTDNGTSTDKVQFILLSTIEMFSPAESSVARLTTTADSPLYMLDTPFLTSIKSCCCFFGTDSLIASPSSLTEMLSSAASTDKVLYIVQSLSIDKYLPLADSYGQIS